MKNYETKTETITVERKVLRSIVCDLCEEQTTTEWQKGSYSATESKIYLKTGSSYPDGGSGELVEIDICPECFMKRLIPWVESQGGTPATTDWDW